MCPKTCRFAEDIFEEFERGFDAFLSPSRSLFFYRKHLLRNKYGFYKGKNQTALK